MREKNQDRPIFCHLLLGKLIFYSCPVVSSPLLKLSFFSPECHYVVAASTHCQLTYLHREKGTGVIPQPFLQSLNSFMKQYKKHKEVCKRNKALHWLEINLQVYFSGFQISMVLAKLHPRQSKS